MWSWEGTHTASTYSAIPVPSFVPRRRLCQEKETALRSGSTLGCPGSNPALQLTRLALKDFGFTPVGMAKLKMPAVSGADEDVKKRPLRCCWWECKMEQRLRKRLVVLETQTM